MTVSTHIESASGGSFSVTVNIGDLIVVCIDGGKSASVSGGNLLSKGAVKINSTYGTYTYIYQATNTSFSFSSNAPYHSYWVITN